VAVHGRADQGASGHRPKIIEAASIVRLYPHEIEADLAFRGIDIADWHRGDMSSRRLIALLQHLPDDSAFKKSHREGDWGFNEYMWAGIVNEVRLLRSDQAAINGQKMDISLIESPAQLEQKHELEKVREVQRAGILAQLRGEDLGKGPDDAS